MVFESGKVIAYGGTNAAGIGGGSGKEYTTGITIKGTAEIEAHGGSGGAGIGSGFNGAFNNIRIQGGTVRAYGGTGNYSGAGIGSGYDELSLTHGAITITGGDVYAEGGREGAGIGGSYRAIVDDVVISGGTIKAVGGKYGCGIGSIIASPSKSKAGISPLLAETRTTLRLSAILAIHQAARTSPSPEASSAHMRRPITPMPLAAAARTAPARRLT